MFTPEKNLNEFQTLYVEKNYLFNKVFFVSLCRYFVFNYAGTNLDDLIKAKRPFAEDDISRIIYSLLRGLKVETLSLQLDIYRMQHSFHVLSCYLVYALSWYYPPCE